jgi:hypothetical protein
VSPLAAPELVPTETHLVLEPKNVLASQKIAATRESARESSQAPEAAGSSEPRKGG